MAERFTKRQVVDKSYAEPDLSDCGCSLLNSTLETETENDELNSDDEELAEFLEAELLDCDDEEHNDDFNNTAGLLGHADDSSNNLYQSAGSFPLAEDAAKRVSLSAGNYHHLGCRKSSSTSLVECDDREKLPTYSGLVGKLPAELFMHILKYLSPEDLSSVAKVCRFLKQQSGEDHLWRRGYCLRWGSPRTRPRGVAWKQLYFDRDKIDMQEFLRNCPEDFRECYTQMQAAKRSQAPRPDQVKDDIVVVESTIALEITAWRRQRSLPEAYGGEHECNGRQCSFHQIDNVFLCEATGRAHVCDENCAETVLDPENQLLVCTVSGRCSDRWLSPEEEEGEQGREGPATTGGDDGEPLMGAGRLGRAYFVGYNCDDERELRAAQRAMGCY